VVKGIEFITEAIGSTSRGEPISERSGILTHTIFSTAYPTGYPRWGDTWYQQHSFNGHFPGQPGKLVSEYLHCGFYWC